MTNNDRSSQYDRDDDRVVVMKNSGNSVLPFLLGIAVGAGVALLFAPQSGEETRRVIGQRARRMRDVAMDKAGELGERAGETFDNVKRRVSDTVDTARETFAQKRSQVSNAMEAGKDAARNARQDIEKRLAETKAAYQAGVRVARESGARDD